MPRIRAVALILTAHLLSAAAVDWPSVPDPLGLGPRLATLDWLREHHVAVPAGASDQLLADLYQDAQAVSAGRGDGRGSEDAARRSALAGTLATSTDARVRVTWAGDTGPVTPAARPDLGEITVDGRRIEAAPQEATRRRDLTAAESRQIPLRARYADGHLVVTIPATAGTGWRVVLGATEQALPATPRDGGGSEVSVGVAADSAPRLTLRAAHADGRIRTWTVEPVRP